MEITQVYIERARELDLRARETKQTGIPKSTLQEMTLSKSTGEHLTARRIRGIIRYGRPMCGRLRHLLNHG